MSNAISSLTLLKNHRTKPSDQDFRLLRETSFKEGVVDDPLELKKKQPPSIEDILGHQKNGRHISILA